MALGPSAGGGANAAQTRNIALCSSLQEVHRAVSALLPRLPPPAATALAAPLDGLQGAAVDTGKCWGLGLLLSGFNFAALMRVTNQVFDLVS